MTIINYFRMRVFISIPFTPRVSHFVFSLIWIIPPSSQMSLIMLFFIMPTIEACYYSRQALCDANYFDRVPCGSYTEYNGCYTYTQCCESSSGGGGGGTSSTSTSSGNFCIRGDNCKCWFDDKFMGYCGGGTFLAVMGIIGCIALVCCCMCLSCCQATGECCKSMSECFRNVFCCGCCCPRNTTTTKTTIINNVERTHSHHTETRRVTLNPVQASIRAGALEMAESGEYRRSDAGIPVVPVAKPVPEKKGPWKTALSGDDM